MEEIEEVIELDLPDEQPLTIVITKQIPIYFETDDDYCPLDETID